MTRLALDHLTLGDATPLALAEQAAATGCDGLCLFLQSMPDLPLMPSFDLVADAGARKCVKTGLTDLGLTLELAYPFTLAGRTEIHSFVPAMAAAAELEARLLNVLIYDRDAARRIDQFGAFCDLADSFGLRVALEFYPASQVRSIGEALEIVCRIDRPGRVGVNVDMLHLMRSGGTLAALAAAPDGMILFGQLADGPAIRPQAEWAWEAASDRQLAGEGAFDLAGFARALPQGCPISVEIPRDSGVHEGHSLAARARLAVDSIRAVLAPPAIISGDARV